MPLLGFWLQAFFYHLQKEAARSMAVIKNHYLTAAVVKKNVNGGMRLKTTKELGNHDSKRAIRYFVNSMGILKSSFLLQTALKNFLI